MCYISCTTSYMRKVLSDMKCIKYNCTTLYKVLSDIQYTKNHCTTLCELLSDRECRARTFEPI